MRTFAIAALVGTASAAVLKADETTHLKGALLRSGKTGYTGAGYLDFGSKPGTADNGGTAQWTFVANRAGTYDVCARYAGNMPGAEVLVNGKGETPLKLAATGSWTKWAKVCTHVHFGKGASSVTLRSATGNAIVDKVTVSYLGYVANDAVDASVTGSLTTLGGAQEHWDGDGTNPTTQTDTYKIGRDQPCRKNGTCPMEKLPRDANGQPTAAFPRQQTHIAHTLTRGGITVRVAANPAGNAGGRWNDALSDTIISKGKFNAQHVFEPQQNNNYNPHVQKACCMDKCQGKKGCEFGCGTWLAKSSLNWEGTHWFDALGKKCAKDCMAKRMATSSPNYSGSSVYEETHFDSLTKDTEAGCVAGCKLFRTCMNAVRAN